MKTENETPVAHDQAQSVPEGWKLVPVEPTEEQRRAVYDEYHKPGASYRSIARAAIAAAPLPPAATPAPTDAIERAARAMALHVGWTQWDTATDFTHTQSGNDPDDERDYFRGLAKVAIQAQGSDAA